jgi:photosystem II stability/assembly factor-like uncharacterized protein
VNIGLTDAEISGLVLSPAYAQDRTLFAGTRGGGVFRSTNRGDTWQRVNIGNADADIRALVLSPAYAQDRTLFAGGVYGSLHRSTDGGATWANVPIRFVLAGDRYLTYLFALALSPSYSAERTIFLGTQDVGVLRSTDDGGTWKTINTGLAATWVEALAVSPAYATDRTVFAGTHDLGLFRSTNRGGSWEEINSGITYSGIVAVAISPMFLNDRTVFALTPYDVFRSIDAGATWSKIPVPSFGFSNVPGFNALVVSPSFTLDRTLFVAEGGPAAAPARGVLRSTDGGNSWQVMNHGLTDTNVRKLAMSPTFATDKTLFAITPGGVFRSKDSGANWEPAKSDLISVFFSPNYISDRTILAGANLARGSRVVDGGGIYRSVDRGDSWELVNGRLPVGAVSELVLSPAYALDHTLFQHRNGDIFRSADGGVTWEQFSDSLTNKSILELVLSPAYNTDHTIFVGTYGGGVFRITGGATVSGTVTLQGRTATFPTDVRHSIATVTLSPGGATANVSADGSYQLPNVAAGTYTVTASAPGYVSRQRTNVVVAASPVTAPSVQLRCGLVNNDNFVNINDITATVASFGKTLANRVDALGRFVDQNGDGFVNINDITCVVSGFGTTSPETWP